MASHRPPQLSTHSSPPFRPHTPDPTHESTLSHSSPTSRLKHAIQGVFFGNAKIQKHAAEELVHEVQQRDEEHHLSLEAQTITTTSISINQGEQQKQQDDARHPEMQRNPSRTRNSRSPSSEARQSDITNKNGFGDKTGTSDEFGWPGLGTWTTSSDSSTQAKLTQNKTDPTSPHPPTAHAISNRDKRLEQVLQEAIDEAADESYGWPGLGGWPSSGKRS